MIHHLKSQEPRAALLSITGLAHFSAARLGCGRTRLAAWTVLPAALRSVCAASQNHLRPHHWSPCVVFVFAALLLMTGGNASAQGTVATDRAALVALYDATGGANWTNSTNWLSSEPLSSWSQVLTDTNGRVTLLSLASNGLSGAIPEELGDLTRLRILNLAENALSGEIPSSLGNLASLERLALNKNGLSGAIPSSLGDLTRLEILWLDSNGLSGAIHPTQTDRRRSWGT